jgi:hypothetical protein
MSHPHPSHIMTELPKDQTILDSSGAKIGEIEEIYLDLRTWQLGLGLSEPASLPIATFSCHWLGQTPTARQCASRKRQASTPEGDSQRSRKSTSFIITASRMPRRTR